MIAWHRARIRSLRSVDDQVKATVDALRATGELANTYIFFTSDNGYLLGEHRLTTKNHPYEQSLRIPLVARGPASRPGPCGTRPTAWSTWHPRSWRSPATPRWAAPWTAGRCSRRCAAGNPGTATT